MLSKRFFQKVQTILIITIILLPIGPLEVYLFIDRQKHTPSLFLTSILSLFLISGLVLSCESFLLNKKCFRQITFRWFSFIRTILYCLIIAGSLFVARRVFGMPNIRFDMSSSQDFFVDGNLLLALVSSLVFAQIINFVTAVNRLIGENMLLRLLVNKYHKPTEEFRIFMFLDIKSSTTIAEKIGHLKFHSLINDFFYLLSDPVLETKGIIHKYVGDEVIIVWNVKDGLKNNGCLRCHFRILEKLQQHAPEFKKQYGLVPAFKSGLHCGNVLVGEMGDIRQEIAFLGDAVNTTARIQGECNALGTDLLISGSLYGLLSRGVDDAYVYEKVEHHALRGKTVEIDLYKVRCKETELTE